MPRIAPIIALGCAGCLAPMASPALAAFPGDNGRILFDGNRGSGDTDIWTIAPNGRAPVNLTAGSKGNDDLGSWSPDGTRIVFMSNRETERNPDPPGRRQPDTELFVMDADGSDPTQLTFNRLDDEDPAWSPDGERIVFVRDFNPVQGKVRYDILTMYADGTGEQNITDRAGDQSQPSWSSTDRIAFTNDRGGDVDLYSMSPDGSNVRQLTRGRHVDEFPDWSPDGSRLAFHRERKGNIDVYTVRAQGGGVRRLTRHADPEGVPAWSPDGREIAYVRFFEEGQGIYTMRADGRRQVKRTGRKFEPFASDWQAQPRMGSGPWGAPQKLDTIDGNSTEINTPGLEGCPILSPDGRSLYIASDRAGGAGGLDIWVAHRDRTDKPFGAPENLSAINSPANDFCPTPLPGRRLLFVSNRPAEQACGMGDIHITQQDAKNGWSTPLRLPCAPAGPNSQLDEQGPSLVEIDGVEQLFFSRSAPPPSPVPGEIFVSPDFGPATVVAELNSPGNDIQPNVRRDGREVVFSSNRVSGNQDIYTATRASTDDPWSVPVPVSAVNTSAAETRPSLSWDATTLLFGRAPGEESALADVFISRR